MKAVVSDSFAVNRTEMFYRRAGSGPALLLLHAGICDSRMWRDQFDAFAPSHRVIAPDLRGFGETAMPTGEYAHRYDVLALMDYLEIAQARIVGASMAGRSAIDLAIEHPERVEALITVGAALSGYVFTDRNMLAIDEAVENALAAKQFDDAAALELKLWLAGPRRDLGAIDPDLVARVREMVMACYKIPPDARAEISLAPPAIHRLGEIRAPTLVIWGEEDVPDIATIGEILVRDIAGAKKSVIANTAHLPNMERPAEFNRIVGAFLSSLA